MKNLNTKNIVGYVLMGSCLLSANCLLGSARNEWALIRAAENGNLARVQALLGTPGINVNATDKYGRTALHLAAQNGHGEVVALLRGAPRINVNASDELRALHWAAEWDRGETIGALLGTLGMDDFKRNMLQTAPDVALGEGEENWATPGKSRLMEALLHEHGEKTGAGILGAEILQEEAQKLRAQARRLREEAD